MEQMPLAKRAWVLQETLLAPRVLSLCGSQMIWECCELSASEAYPNGIPCFIGWLAVKRGEEYFKTFGSLKELDVTGKPDSISIEETRKLWGEILISYTRRQLIYPSDKLVALSGVANIMTQALDDEYCVGMWRSHLLQDLCWFCEFWFMTSIDPPPFGSGTGAAPSWSWASRDDGIWSRTHNLEGKAVANIVCCVVQTATADQTCAVERGELRLSGSLITMRVYEDGARKPKVFYNGKVNEGMWHDGIRLDHHLLSPNVHCLPLFSDEPENLKRGLLLVPTGVARGQFRRVGLFWSEHLITQIKLPELAQFRNEDWMKYEEDCGDGKYVVSII